jgi:hypothetical protein
MLFDKGISALIRPKEVLAAEKKNSSLLSGTKEILIASLIFVVLNSIIPVLGGVSPLTILTVTIFTIVGVLVAFFIENILFYIFAKLLGGKGSFKEQFYLIALFTAPLIVMSILGSLPFVGGIIYVLLLLYSLYPLTVAIREAQQISTVKAILVWFIPLVLSVVVGLVIFGFLGWIPGMAGTLLERQARGYWASNYPVAIRDYKITPSGATLLVENIGEDQLMLTTMSATLEGVEMSGIFSPPNYKLLQGEAKSYTISGIKCVSGKEFRLEDVMIGFDVVKGISGQIENGDRPLIGTCG